MRDEASAKMKRVSQQARGLGIAMSALGAATVFAGVKFAQAALEQERAMKVLGTAINNTGTSFAAVRTEIEKTTAALQRKTNFGDEAQFAILTKIVAITGDYGQALQALPAILDAATASGRSADSVATTLTRALVGQANVAESVGLRFEETADFGERLAQVMGAVGGAAIANADPFVQLGNDIGDLKEVIGAALLPVLTDIIGRVREFVASIQDWVKENPKLASTLTKVAFGLGAMFAIVGPLILILPTLVSGITILGSALLFLATNPIGAVVAALGVLLVLFTTNTFGIRDKTIAAVKKIIEIYRSWVGWLLPSGILIKSIVFFAKNWRDILDSIGNAMASFINFFINNFINPMIDAINSVRIVFGKDLIGTLDEVEVKFGFVDRVLENTRDVLLEVGRGIAVVQPQFDKLADSADDVKEAVKGMSDEVKRMLGFASRLDRIGGGIFGFSTTTGKPFNFTPGNVLNDPNATGGAPVEAIVSGIERALLFIGDKNAADAFARGELSEDRAIRIIDAHNLAITAMSRQTEATDDNTNAVLRLIAKISPEAAAGFRNRVIGRDNRNAGFAPGDDLSDATRQLLFDLGNEASRERE